MASIFGGLFSRVIKIRIDGKIQQLMTDRVIQMATRYSLIKPEAIAIVINSPGGSLTQAKNISDFLRQYAEKKSVPIYSFAEDICLGSANVLLTTGVKAYASDMSVIGDFGFSWSSLWFKKFADKYNVKQEFIFSGQNKVKFNPFEDIRPDSEKWMQNYLYQLEHELKPFYTEISKLPSLSDNQMTKQDIEQKVFKGLTIQPEKAIKHGLIDGILTFDQLMNTRFKNTKVHNAFRNGLVSEIIH